MPNDYGIDDSHNYMKPTDPNASFDPKTKNNQTALGPGVGGKNSPKISKYN
jgi:hypothetical protein